MSGEDAVGEHLGWTESTRMVARQGAMLSKAGDLDVVAMGSARSRERAGLFGHLPGTRGLCHAWAPHYAWSLVWLS